MLNTGLKFVSGKYTSYINIIGIDPEAMKYFEFNLAQGRLLEKEDTNAVVFGSFIPRQFYNPKSMGRFGPDPNQKPPVDVLNDKMLMTFDFSYGERRPMGAVPDPQNQKPPKLFKVKGVGLLAESRNEKDYSVYMNIDYLKKLIRENERSQSGQGRRGMGMSQQQGYQQVLVRVKNMKDVEKVQKQINDLGFGAHSLADIRKSMQKTSGTLQAILGGIGAISLLVAALGITNTMIMSIYERTREIGVMKVLGCLLGDIRRLFLFEAGMIGFLGGAVGIGLSFGASFLLNVVGAGFMNGMGGPPGPDGPNKISIVPLWLALASVGFATFIGLVSGFYPARRAMRLSALEAIRTE